MHSNDRAITGLAATGHALVHTYELSIPILMTVWLQAFDVSSAVLGLVVTAGYALFGLGALPAGILTDRYGSKRLVMTCLAGMGGAFLLLSMAQGLLLIMGALVLWGTAASLYHPAGLALISKGAVRRGHVFAYHGIAGNLGTALGPLAATVLLLFFDWRTVSVLLALPALAALPLVARLRIDEGDSLDSTNRRDVQALPTFSWRAFWRDSRTLFASAFVFVFAIVMLEGLFYRGILTFLPELLGRFAVLDPMSLGSITMEPGRYVYVGMLLVGVLGQYVGGRLSDRLPLARTIAAGFGLLGIIVLLYLPLAGLGLGFLLGISAVLGFFLFGLQPFYQAAVAEYTPVGTRGLSYGYNYLAIFGIGALGAALAGGVLSLFNAQVLFVLLAVMAATAVGLALTLRRRTVTVGEWGSG